MRNVKHLTYVAGLTICLNLVHAQSSIARPVGPGSVIVTPTMNGTILGFDIDQSGTEGLLSEFVQLNNGYCPYGTETFDQKTGSIIKIVRRGTAPDCGDGDVTWGVMGPSVGLVMHEHSVQFDRVANTYQVLNPLDRNELTGAWALDNKGERVSGVSRNQGTPVNAFQVFNYFKQLEYVFGSDVASNRLGPQIQIASTPGIIGLNTKTNTAVLANSDGPFGPTIVIQADLATGAQTTFIGSGSGEVQGLAVDSADNIATTATYGDAGVEFYDLTTQTLIGYDVLPDCTTPACSGFDVEFDPIHKVFLVAQPISSQLDNSSTIYVYDTQGDLLETLNGFNFYTQRFDVYPVHIALHPSDRSGFVDVTNDLGVGAIQSFTY